MKINVEHIKIKQPTWPRCITAFVCGFGLSFLAIAGMGTVAAYITNDPSAGAFDLGRVGITSIFSIFSGFAAIGWFGEEEAIVHNEVFK